MSSCTISSRCGRIDSNIAISENSKGSKVGHQQIARFFGHILFRRLFSATLCDLKRAMISGDSTTMIKKENGVGKKIKKAVNSVVVEPDSGSVTSVRAAE